jgi:hypothetical protein
MAYTTILSLIKYVCLFVSSILGATSSREKLIQLRNDRIKRKLTSSYDAIASIYPILQEMLNKFSEIDRVTLFRSHNGTGIPKVGTLTYTSCIQEIHTSRTTSIIDRWQKIPSDQLMINVITGIHGTGYASLPVTSSSCPTGILTDFCLGNNIKNVLAVPVVYQPDGLLFMNFCSATCKDLLDVDGILFEANSCAARVANAINSNHIKRDS